MDMEKGTLAARRLFTAASAQQLIDSRVPLPQGRSAAAVLSADCAIRVTEAVCAGALVKTAGELTLTMLLAGDDQEPYSFTASSAFTHRMELREVTEHMEPAVTAQLLECECVPEGDAVRLTAVAELSARVFLQEDAPVLRSLSGPGIELLPALIHVSRKCLLAKESFRIREEINAPSGEKVLTAAASACCDSAVLTAGGAQVEGQLHLRLVVEDGHGQLSCLNASLPFKDVLPTELYASGIWAEAQLTALTCSAADAGFGVCDVDATMLLSVYGVENEPQTAVADAYDCAGSFSCVTRPMNLLQCRGQAAKRERVGENLLVPKELPEAYRPVSAVILPAVTGVDGDAGQLSVDVMLITTAVYQCDGGFLHAFHEDIPVRVAVEAPYLDQSTAAVQLLSAQLSGSGRALALYVELLIEAELWETQQISCAVDIVPQTPASQGKGIFIYCTEAGESLWSVGKRFGIPVSQLAAMNQGVSDPIPEGTRLLFLKEK